MSLVMTLALAAAAPVQAVEAPAATAQQAFDAASAAAAAGECEKAVSLFEALERRQTLRPGSLPAAAVASRKGRCLVRLGRSEEGEGAILAGLPGLERAGPDFKVDIADSQAMLGEVALARWDFAEARQRYEKAYAMQLQARQLYYLVGLIKASAFDPGPQPLAYADEAIGLASAGTKPSKEVIATVRTLKARILLNRGESEAAYAELKAALDLQGGLSFNNVTLHDVSSRGDLALAAMLLGRKEDARRYLAYTGAGRIAASPFATAAAMSPPDCGDATGLRPEDIAVVEFAIGDDGAVDAVQTIYARGGPEVAAAFARAVSEWYWQPGAVAKIPRFYRLATRVELRCSAAGGPSPSLLAPLTGRFNAWAATKLTLPRTHIGDKPQLVAALRSELAKREGAGDTAGQIAAIGMLAIADPRVSAQTTAQLDRAIAMGEGAGVPVEVINALRIFRLYCAGGESRQRGPRGARPAGRSQLAALLQDPAIAADAIAADSLRLLDAKATPAAVQQVAGDDRLPPHHPLRQAALLKLANRAADAGDLAAAQSFFARTGLTEQQCALLGVKPRMRSTGAGPGDFPREAMYYGFEGWVNLEFDIAADGRTANARPVIAYPPFVFVDAARGMTGGIRYEASYRPGGGAACNAERETIRFVIGG